MTEPNIPLLRKAIEWVEVESQKSPIDSEWFQEDWTSEGPGLLENLYVNGLIDETTYESQTECGTAYCVAGYVAQMTKGAVNTYTSDWQQSNELNPVRSAISNEGHAANVAMKELGLTEDQAFRLFSGDNDAKDIRNIAEEIAGERL